MNAHTDSGRNERGLAVIIGRAGSKGLPKKNALDVAGVAMIARTIRFAIASTSIDRVNRWRRPRRDCARRRR